MTEPRAVYVVVTGSFGNPDPGFDRMRTVVAFRDPERAKRYAAEAQKISEELRNAGLACELIREHKHLAPYFLLNPLDPASRIGDPDFSPADDFAVHHITLLNAVPSAATAQRRFSAAQRRARRVVSA